MLLWSLLSPLMVVSTLAFPTNLSKESSVLDKIKLVGFSDEQKTQVRDALEDTMTLANAVIEGAGETNTTEKAAFKTIYLKYFPEPKYELVMSIFSNVTGGAETKYTGNTVLEKIPVKFWTSSDYKDICEEDQETEAFMAKEKHTDEEIVICPRALRLGGIDKSYNKETKAITCDGFGGSLRHANPLGASLLHEFMHYAPLVSPPLDSMTFDYQYGPWYCQHALDLATEAIYNADSYTWFASEVFWSKKCQRTYMEEKRAGE